MQKKRFFKYSSMFLCIALLAFFVGCKDKKSNIGTGNTQTNPKPSAIATEDLRPNTATVLTPKADGIATEENAAAIVDYSNTSQGYIIAKYNGSAKKAKLLMTGPDGIRYQYILDGEQQVFPLTSGDGDYLVGVYENIVADEYNPAMSITVTVSIENELLPYLYPNVYVNFDENTKAVKVGEQVALEASNDIDVVTNVYNYVMELIEYDYDKIDGLQFGYAPDPDETLSSKKGICFDYAALMATMLRTQNIPTNLQVGWAGTIYHAWVSVYIKDVGWVNGIVKFDGEQWTLMDPTFADGDAQSKEVMDFISADANYKLMYKY